MNLFDNVRNEWWLGIIAIVILFLSHFLFSPLGFNPSDEGFILAYARRIMDGEIPHTDFISIRPVFSAYLHFPVVLLFHDLTFYFSRFLVWAQFVFIAWAWTILISRNFRISLNLREVILLYLIILIFNVHNFPILAWHTVDGIFLITIGLLILQFPEKIKFSTAIGYLMIGFSIIVKQNFLPVALLIPFLRGNFKMPLVWGMIFLPTLLYLLMVTGSGGFTSFINQLFSETSIIDAGILAYLKEISFYTGVAIGILPFAINYFLKNDQAFYINRILIPFLILASSVVLVLNKYSVTYSFFIAGIFLGYWASFYNDRKLFTFGGIIAILSWSVSVSKGYNTPALMTGVLLGFIYLSGKVSVPEGKNLRITHLVFPVLFLVFYYVRTTHVYRDKSHNNLTYEIGEVFPGGKNIRTNKNTFKKLNELDSLRVLYPGEKIAILPDFAAFWVESEQENPLDMDWVAGIEIQKEEIRSRLIGNLQKEKPMIIFIQKEKARTFQMIDSAEKVNNPLGNYVKENGIKVNESVSYEIFRFGSVPD